MINNINGAALGLVTISAYKAPKKKGKIASTKTYVTVAESSSLSTSDSAVGSSASGSRAVSSRGGSYSGSESMYTQTQASGSTFVSESGGSVFDNRSAKVVPHNDDTMILADDQQEATCLERYA